MPTMQIDTDQLSALFSSTLTTGTAVDALAALCCTLGLDPTLWPLSATTTGRVLTSMGRQSGLREAATGCGAIQIFTTTALPAVPAVPICIDPHLPEDMEGALLAAGVEPDAVNTLYFDAAHGPVFRQRIKGKWKTFCDLVTQGLVQNPTGFFISAVRKNWMLSSSYVPGLKKPTPVSRAEQERQELQAQRETAAGLHQQQVEIEQQRLRQAQPDEQWHASRSLLWLHLGKVLLSGEWQVLERLCLAGRMHAAELATMATRAKAALSWDAFLSDLRGQLMTC